MQDIIRLMAALASPDSSVGGRNSHYPLTGGRSPRLTLSNAEECRRWQWLMPLRGLENSGRGAGVRENCKLHKAHFLKIYKQWIIHASPRGM